MLDQESSRLIPSSCLLRFIIFLDTPRILAIFVHEKCKSLRNWSCWAEITYLGLPALPEFSVGHGYSSLSHCLSSAWAPKWLLSRFKWRHRPFMSGLNWAISRLFGFWELKSSDRWMTTYRVSQASSNDPPVVWAGLHQMKSTVPLQTQVALQQRRKMVRSLCYPNRHFVSRNAATRTSPSHAGCLRAMHYVINMNFELTIDFKVNWP